MLNTDISYEIDIETQISFEVGDDGEAIITESIDTVTFQEEAAGIPQMDGGVVVETAEVITLTSSPSKSPCEYKTSSLLLERSLGSTPFSLLCFFCVCAAPSISTKPSYGEDPSLSPSLSTMPSGQPSLSIRPSEAVEIAPYYGYKFVGYGFCLGKVGGNHVFQTSQYNYLEFQNALFVAPSLCPEACAAYTQTEYRGFEFETGKCRCLFDGGIDFSTVTHHGGAPDVTYDENTAAGIVTDSDDSNDLVRCYKTSLPVAPETVDGFEYIGFGNCWSEALATYDYTAITLPSETNPAAQCGAACSLSNYPQSRGFFTQSTVCNCLFDADFTDPSVTITDDGGGTGQISSSNYVEGHCYSVLPAPTPKPTKMPTPKPVSTKVRFVDVNVALDFMSDILFHPIPIFVYCFSRLQDLRTNQLRFHLVFLPIYLQKILHQILPCLLGLRKSSLMSLQRLLCRLKNRHQILPSLLSRVWTHPNHFARLLRQITACLLPFRLLHLHLLLQDQVCLLLNLLRLRINQA